MAQDPVDRIHTPKLMLCIEYYNTWARPTNKEAAKIVIGDFEEILKNGCWRTYRLDGEGDRAKMREEIQMWRDRFGITAEGEVKEKEEEKEVEEGTVESEVDEVVETDRAETDDKKEKSEDAKEIEDNEEKV